MEQLGKLLTIEELAGYLSVSPSWIYEQSRLRRRNGFPVLKLGKYLRFDLEAVRQWAAEQAKKA